MSASQDSVCDAAKDEVCSPKVEDEGAREQIDKLTRSDGNDMCADCGELSKLACQPLIQLCMYPVHADPQWASVNFGIFICIKCAGIHRSLSGLYSSKVRSVRLDSWTPDMVKASHYKFQCSRCLLCVVLITVYYQNFH